MQGGIAYITWTVADIDRFQTFWSGLFSWEFSQGSAGGYHVVNANVPLGVRQGVAVRDSSAVSFTFAVHNLAKAIAQVRELGGSSSEPTGDPRWNTVDCHDSQGNPFSLWEPYPDTEFQFDSMWKDQQQRFAMSVAS